MQGMSQRDIAAKIGVSVNTTGKWAKQEGWDARRAANTITRSELVNKTLTAINNLLNAYNQDPSKSLEADKLCKLAKIISGLDKKANVVDVIEAFMAFNKWLQFRMQTDKDITPELLRAINHYQDLYITELITSNE